MISEKKGGDQLKYRVFATGCTTPGHQEKDPRFQ